MHEMCIHLCSYSSGCTVVCTKNLHNLKFLRYVYVYDGEKVGRCCLDENHFYLATVHFTYVSSSPFNLILDRTCRDALDSTLITYINNFS